MDKPIGYWLKHLDALIDADFERTLADSGLTRRHWQILNSLTEGPRGADQLSAALRPFWGEGAITLDDALAALRARGWIAAEGTGGRYALTPLGAEGRAVAAERVGATRRRLMDGLTDEQYADTVRVLRRMAANLEPASPAA